VVTETFGQRMVKLRESLNVNKAELARLTGITRTAIGNYENKADAKGCSVPHLMSLCRVSGWTLDYLVTGNEGTAQVDIDSLTAAVAKTKELMPRDPADKQAKLIKFIYTLHKQGQTPTNEVLAGFYQSL